MRKGRLSRFSDLSHICFICTYVCTLWTCLVTMEARRHRHPEAGGLESGWLWATVQVLEIKRGCSVRITRVLNCWAVSLVPWNLISYSHKTCLGRTSFTERNWSCDCNWRNGLLLKNRLIHLIFQINKPKVNSRICARCLDDVFTLDHPTRRRWCETVNPTESQAGSACGALAFLFPRRPRLFLHAGTAGKPSCPPVPMQVLGIRTPVLLWAREGP